MNERSELNGERARRAAAASRMVAQARVELATPASSGQRSTDELPGHVTRGRRGGPRFAGEDLRTVAIKIVLEKCCLRGFGSGFPKQRLYNVWVPWGCSSGLRPLGLRPASSTVMILLIAVKYFWGCSSADRALHSHCRGQGFKSPQLHHIKSLRDHVAQPKTKKIL